MDTAGFRERIAECNRHDLTRYLPLRTAGQVVGWIRRERRELLAELDPAFEHGEHEVRLLSSGGDFDSRSAVLARAAHELVRRGELPGLHGEPYPLVRSFGDPPLASLDRSAAPWFGARAFGVHLNGYVRRSDGLYLWVAHRSTAKPTYPGMLDNMVAGGQPLGLGLVENLRKECAEEASIPPALVRRAAAVGAITYVRESALGLKPDTLFCYDLELPADFIPINTDGEVESFELLPVRRVAEIVATTRRFKLNCNIVVIDFLVRHGLADPALAPLLRSLLP